MRLGRASARMPRAGMMRPAGRRREPSVMRRGMLQWGMTRPGMIQEGVTPRAGVMLPSAATMRRLGSLRRSVSPLAAILLTLLAVGCRIPGGSSGQMTGSQQIAVAVVPGFANAPLQVAVRDGLFSQRHLDVMVQTYQTLQQAYAALASGQADVISGDYASLLYQQAHAAHGQLRLIADGYDASPGVMEVLTLPGSAITNPQGLEGKAVATPPQQLAPFSAAAPYNIETLATEAVLQSDGVSPSSIQWKPMPATTMIGALRDHTVSAIVTTQPYILQAETQLGAVELLDACSGVAASLPLSGYFAAAGFVRSHPAAMGGFQSALNAAKASTAQPGTVQSVLRTLPGMSAREAALVTIGQYPTFLSVGQVQRVADLMADTGMITAPVSVRSLVFR
jgi:NitT/TauT family transport system substrate-binding protein